MRLAWETATARDPFDRYLWLNDDVVLDPGALDRLLGEAATRADSDGAAIVCGSTRLPGSDTFSYGGQRRTHPDRPLRFAVAAP